jgi:hypothetical protein
VEYTEAQSRIVEAIRKLPGGTLDQIGLEAGVSSIGTVSFHIQRLRSAGMLKREPCPHCSRPAWVVTE